MACLVSVYNILKYYLLYTRVSFIYCSSGLSGRSQFVEKEDIIQIECGVYTMAKGGGRVTLQIYRTYVFVHTRTYIHTYIR